jgi:hypothetical protein
MAEPKSTKSSGSKSGGSDATAAQAAQDKAKRPGFLETLRHGWKPAHKRPTATATAKKPTTEKPAAAAGAASTGPGGKKVPPANMQERMEGLQGWMAELERKQERMTRIGGIALAVAVATAAAAIVLGVLGMQSAASDDDVDKLRDEVNALSGSIEQQTEDQLGGLNQKLSTLEGQVKSLQQQQQQQAQTISNLQRQVNRAAAAAAGAGAGAGADAGAGAAPANPTIPGIETP